MSIKAVERNAIELAMKKFDEKLRDSADWIGWERNKSQLHAIYFEGRYYPPKKVISIATGMPVADFQGGRPSNNYLIALKFKIVPIQSMAVKPNVQFQIGKTYDRKKNINGPFGGSAQSGIAPSTVANVIFVFSGESGGQYGYNDKDEVDDGGGSVFAYTGEGQVGDMEFTRGNRAILEHGKNGRALHLFRALGKSKGQKYLGEFVYASHHLAQGPDKNGNQRQLIIFHLVSVEQAASLESSDESELEANGLPTRTLAEARSLAIAAAGAAVGKPGESAIRTLYKRSKAVKDYVLMRSKGLCEVCKRPAPFLRVNGTPYLEPHHTTRVSDGGPDHPRYVGAVCPACHREIHHGKDGAVKNAELQSLLFELEAAS